MRGHGGGFPWWGLTSTVQGWMQPKGEKMGIPQKVSQADLIDALKRNREGIDRVEAKLDLGHLNDNDLEYLAMIAGRTTYLCRELIRWRNFQIQMKAAAKAAAKEEGPSLEWE